MIANAAPASQPPCGYCSRRPQPGRQVLAAGHWRTFDGCACTWEGTPEAEAAARRRREQIERDMREIDPSELHDATEGAA